MGMELEEWVEVFYSYVYGITGQWFKFLTCQSVNGGKGLTLRRPDRGPAVQPGLGVPLSSLLAPPGPGEKGSFKVA